MQEKTTKHAMLRKWILDHINDGSFGEGEKLISENELCSNFGISRHTVRHALDALESEGYLDRRRGSGTYIRTNPAKRRQPTRNIGVIMPYFDDYIFPSILQGIDRVLSRQGYNIMLGVTYNKVEDERRLLNDYIQKGVDGIIEEAVKSALPSSNTDLFKELDDLRVPIVFINTYHQDFGSARVTVDDRKGTWLAANSLIKAGHRRIGGIFKLDDRQGRERYAGYVQAMHENNLSIPENSVQWYSTEDMEDLFSGEFDRVLIRRLTGCTGAVCYNDQIAYRLVELLERNGIRVPEDISITGFDDSSLSKIGKVKLTTVTHPGEHLGERAATILYELLCGENPEQSYIFEPELVERDSVKVLAAGNK